MVCTGSGVVLVDIICDCVFIAIFCIRVMTISDCLRQIVLHPQSFLITNTWATTWSLYIYSHEPCAPPAS